MAKKVKKKTSAALQRSLREQTALNGANELKRILRIERSIPRLANAVQRAVGKSLDARLLLARRLAVDAGYTFERNPGSE